VHLPFAGINRSSGLADADRVTDMKRVLPLSLAFVAAHLIFIGASMVVAALH
jgi:hypothetical protein